MVADGDGMATIEGKRDAHYTIPEITCTVLPPRYSFTPLLFHNINLPPTLHFTSYARTDRHTNTPIPPLHRTPHIVLISHTNVYL